jgi:hypothetical protein
MAQPKKGLRDRVQRLNADELLYVDQPITRDTGVPESQVPSVQRTTHVPRPSGKPITRAARGVQKKTYTLPLEVIENIDKLHAHFFMARPGKEPIEKSQIASAALELGLAQVEELRRALFGDELDEQLEN